MIPIVCEESAGIFYKSPGIHIRSRPVVPDDLKPVRTSIITPKVVRWTSEVKVNVFSQMSSRAIIKTDSAFILNAFHSMETSRK